MSRSATLPSIRVTPGTKARIEAVLRRGETLTQFIENAVRREAEVRSAQDSAVARAKKSLLSADKGVSLQTVEDLLKGMERRAEEAQSRIREAATAKNKT